MMEKSNPHTELPPPSIGSSGIPGILSGVGTLMGSISTCSRALLLLFGAFVGGLWLLADETQTSLALWLMLVAFLCVFSSIMMDRFTAVRIDEQPRQQVMAPKLENSTESTARRSKTSKEPKKAQARAQSASVREAHIACPAK